MPQGRKKVPFSGKAKKEQLKAKKQVKNTSQAHSSKKHLVVRKESDDDTSDEEVVKINSQPRAKTSRGDPNRYVLQFRKETDDEMKRQKEMAYEKIVKVSDEELEIGTEQFYGDDLEFPKRPSWSYEMSRDELEAREHRYFNAFVKNLERVRELGYIELNLETWRQLWRVLEMSDIVLFIVDIRFSAAMFPPSLFKYVTDTLGKKMILALNKIDLAPAPLVVAWKKYFEENFIGLTVLMFTTFPGYNLRNAQSKPGGLQTRRRRGKMRMAAEGARILYDACKQIVGDRVDLSPWHDKILEEISSECDSDDLEVGETVDPDPYVVKPYESYASGVLTIGCVGQPNVGKSSLMNALMGRKVVSVSRTPGHTKHFQTIFLTKNVRLCDCPGLVFPSKTSKMLQVLTGAFPIAQLRVPYPPVQYVAERIDLVKMLSIDLPDPDEYSAIDICEAWARKRGFFTAKASRPDTYRAANNLLRMQLDGRICICLRPPGFRAADFESHPDRKTVEWIQASRRDDSETIVEESDSESTRESSLLESDSPGPANLANKFAMLGETDE